MNIKIGVFTEVGRTLANLQPATLSVSFAFSALRRNDSSDWDSLSSCQLANLILDELQQSLVLPTMADSMYALGKEYIGSLLEIFLMKPSYLHCNGLETCSHALTVAYNQLRLSLFNLYAAAALVWKEGDDELEALQEEMGCLRAENERIHQTLDTVSREKAVSLETVASLRQDLTTVEQHLESYKLHSAQNEDKVKRLLTDNEDLRMEMGAVKTTVCS